MNVVQTVPTAQVSLRGPTVALGSGRTVALGMSRDMVPPGMTQLDLPRPPGCSAGARCGPISTDPLDTV
ncbi:hypothetical protein GCM10009744_31220 [Kribbella alba]|uniref:Uncharacterized protein n=1 Tax=Kribbella alba TaxID=190197 RepID=A0ABN2FDH2_9ACTN